MIREERSVDFWFDVLTDPVVASMMGYEPDRDDVARSLGRTTLLPLAAEHGGFWFAQLDHFARLWELHTMFTPAGWGREVHGAAKQAFTKVFTETQCIIVVTHEMESNPKSRPPLSFGFEPVGGFAPTVDGMGPARAWILTYDRWFGSPAGRRQCQ